MNAWFKRAEKLKKPRALLPDLLDRPKGVWLDAACGDGVFGEVLLEYALPGTTLLGLDINLDKVRRFNRSISAYEYTVLGLVGDLNREIPFSNLDGIVIANTLHFFPEREQLNVLRRFNRSLKYRGSLVIVEYNADHSTGPVPYPIPLERIARLLVSAGFKSPQRTSRVASSYLGEMYAVISEKDHMQR